MPTADYDPRLPWGGHGSPCVPSVIAFPDLADCRECLMCGGCEMHDECASDWNHITWFTQFASPGEPACKSRGTVAAITYECALPLEHGGGWHMAAGGSGWPCR